MTKTLPSTRSQHSYILHHVNINVLDSRVALRVSNVETWQGVVSIVSRLNVSISAIYFALLEVLQ